MSTKNVVIATKLLPEMFCKSPDEYFEAKSVFAELYQVGQTVEIAGFQCKIVSETNEVYELDFGEVDVDSLLNAVKTVFRSSIDMQNFKSEQAYRVQAEMDYYGNLSYIYREILDKIKQIS